MVIQVPAGVQAGEVIHVSVPLSAPLPAAQAVPVQATMAAHAVPAVPMAQFTMAGAGASAEDIAYAEILLRSRSWVSCFALIDVFLVILSIFTRLGWWGLLLLLGPLYGYYGAKSLNPSHLLVYVVFKVIHCVIYTVALFAADGTGEFLWALLLVVCELYITREVVRFYRMLKKMDGEALMRAMQHIRALPMQQQQQQRQQQRTNDLL